MIITALIIEKVDYIPEVIREESRPRHDLQDLLSKFVDGNDDIVVVKFTKSDYKNSKTAHCAIWLAVKKSGYNIKVHKRGDDIYLEKMKRTGNYKGRSSR